MLRKRLTLDLVAEPIDRKPLVFAAIAASVLMLSFGIIYRCLLAQAGCALNREPLDVDVLATLPLEIADWKGHDIPLDEATVRATDSDAHINRRYVRQNGLDVVSLYIACGTDGYEVMGHRPPGCYIAAGLSHTGYTPLQVRRKDGTVIDCGIFEFLRGGVDATRITVLHYFFVDGKSYGEVSPELLQNTRNFRRVHYVAQVQIGTATRIGSRETATKCLLDFAHDSAAAIEQLLNTSLLAEKAQPPSKAIDGE